MTIKKNSIQLQYLDMITAFFVTVLLVSNVASSKITSIGPFTFDAGTILFPLSYIFGDIFTEVYGFSRARKMIWIGFFCNVLMGLIILLVQFLPPSPDWHNQKAFESILGLTPRIVLASLIAYLVGEFTNTIILAKLKIKTQGKSLWLRTIGSSVLGELLDTIIFVYVAFWGIFASDILTAIILSNYVFKLGVEVLFTPLTYFIVGKLKKIENADYYDYKTNFTPFSIETKEK